MKPENILRAEQLLGVTLPPEYKNLMTSKAYQKQELPDSLLDDIDSLIGINREMRDGEFKDEWHHQWLVIGHDACGDLFFMDLTMADSPIYLWDHETHDSSIVADNLNNFINDELQNPSR